MKRLFACFGIILLLTSCTSAKVKEQPQIPTEINADVSVSYGNEEYTARLNTALDNSISLEILSPKTISGLKIVSSADGVITSYDTMKIAVDGGLPKTCPFYQLIELIKLIKSVQPQSVNEINGMCEMTYQMTNAQAKVKIDTTSGKITEIDSGKNKFILKNDEITS